ncbi:MAG: protein-export chaperone SecB [Desulfuromonadales bacterium]
MAADNVLMDFRDCRLLTVHFELNREFEPGPDVQLSTNLTLTHVYFDDERGKPCLRLFVKLLLQGEGAPLRAEIEVGGVFGVSRKPADVVEATKIAEINGAAIVFPYLRETVADLTRRSGLPPLHLPPINFVELYGQNHPAELLP